MEIYCEGRRLMEHRQRYPNRRRVVPASAAQGDTLAGGWQLFMANIWDASEAREIANEEGGQVWYVGHYKSRVYAVVVPIGQSASGRRYWPGGIDCETGDYRDGFSGRRWHKQRRKRKRDERKAPAPVEPRKVQLTSRVKKPKPDLQPIASQGMLF